MANTVIRHLKLSDNSIAHLMQIINGIAENMSMPPVAYVEMYRSLNDKHWAEIILNMAKNGQREWVAGFMPSGDN
jgi:hypothetical protein